MLYYGYFDKNRGSQFLAKRLTKLSLASRQRGHKETA